ncbi:phytase-like protein with esterase activity [Chromohalobacter marismortui]|uniref:Phytase-like protein with esterase activity n=1 Tax=Chromohalobacter marismortui TaxID=42055 RepID=A0A4R7ND10_9GAMM|nr:MULTISPECIES: esterase-like activity of phytase family protein [Chromohalobacter]MCI0592982.1 esterase-like activity of phytase family protein [Chromohalobacter sp.]TDU18058.1 phytase-like protein with esterase activity [Chromohalobacter marismortui]
MSFTPSPLAGLLGLSAVIVTFSQPVLAAETFNRIASFPVASNLEEGAAPDSPTSAEIITVDDEGKTLMYSDSPHGGIGFIDITEPAAPKAAGFMPMEGEPTSVSAFHGVALVGVNTSQSYTEPSGELRAVELKNQRVRRSCQLGGQPDSVAISPDDNWVAIAIENERDEEANDGRIPQMPAGYLMVFPLAKGVPSCDDGRKVALTGLADTAPSDPEPEFVDINAENQIAVTLQENNHIVIVDAASGRVVGDFSAGSTDLAGVDTAEDGRLAFKGRLEGVKREPDAVQWLGTDRLVTANEGDYEGGSRGFTIFNQGGSVAYESGAAFEHAVAAAGHYPEGRSDAKGIEPEGLEVGTYDGQRYIFVLSERGSVVGVYRDTGGAPELMQPLPSGVGPEGAVAIPGRQLLATSNEEDLGAEGGARSHVMIYRRTEGKTAYPEIVAQRNDDGTPVTGWGALSGLTGDPEDASRLYAVSDSAYANAPTLYTIGKSSHPARITSATVVTRDGEPASKLDLEGIATDGEGGFWLANEGDAKQSIPHVLLHVDHKGEIQEQIPLPSSLLERQTRYGAEGIVRVEGKLWVALQRPWLGAPDNTAMLLAYDLEKQQWQGVRYPLTKPQGEGWVGLSDLAAKDAALYLIERDNQTGDAARIKQITRVDLGSLAPAALDGNLPTAQKEVVLDLIPTLLDTGGYVLEKVEGLTFDADGQGYVVTDNDGVDGSSGETRFFPVELGR